jgi:hypothetical protein
MRRGKMTPELEQQLYAKYPKIFRQKDLSASETCMCWGICCADGWYNLIDNLCAQIQNHVDSSDCPQIEAVQLKEKFGNLRMYTNHSDDTIDAFISLAEDLSDRTCEFCGTTENIGHTQGWIITCCEPCLRQTGSKLQWIKDDPQGLDK